MSFFFILNNLHFSLEILGALAFGTVAWLSFDAFRIRKDFTTISRGIGFILLAAWQVIHAFGFVSEVYGFAGYGIYFFGLLFVAANLALEAPTERPQFKGVVILPALTPLLPIFNAVASITLLLIVLLSFRQYKKELKKTLAPFVLAFTFLFLGAVAAVFSPQDSFTNLWIAGHILELLGFASLGWWVWQYLQLRIREELLLIFISVTLLMAVVVTLTFSSILVNRIETQTRASLLTDARVLNFATTRLQEEARAKADLLAYNLDLRTAVEENNFVALEKIATDLFRDEKLGFLIILDAEGGVMLRAHGLTKKGDNLSAERAVEAALAGESLSTIESSEVEQFSIRAASPLIANDKVIGVVVAGFPLDNAFVDSIKKITGLEMSIFRDNTRVATTSFNPDGRTRSVGIKQVDQRVSDAVLSRGESITVRTEILSRPFLASYLPIKNVDGQIVGMMSAAQAQEEIAEIANSTNQLTLISVVILMLILTAPIYLVTRRLGREV